MLAMTDWGAQRAVYKSAVCVIPPESLWEPIQEIRKEKDKVFARWPPHINLLFPFVSDEHFEEAAKVLKDRLKDFNPFNVEFKEFSAFQQSKSSTVWLKPETDHPDTFQDLQRAVETPFPSCTQQSTKPNGFHPHLTVGQWPKNQTSTAINNLNSKWEPFSFIVKEVYMISRTEEDPFEIRQVIPLGGTISTVPNLDRTPHFKEYPVPLNIKKIRNKSTSIFVGNIPRPCKEEDLKKYFVDLGLNVVTVEVMKKYSFVELETEEEQKIAIQKTNGVEWNGKILNVSEPT
eukprot:TRINITY_DN2045_c0_g1_i1.p1 TRINITY_DN2045_c0_g1~~TRINITY_DN2045_c0_g1_i1.p1  ORF type:complete len:289 (+),score=57.88 TRINITY_DN2045_c0_g1_i1:80-946(+)